MCTALQRIEVKNRTPPRSLVEFLQTRYAIWYRLAIVTAIITVIIVFIIPINLYPWAYLRNFFGLVFVLLLPGYVCIRALFPVNSNNSELKNFSGIERIILGTAISLALVALLGLILNVVPKGFSLPAMVLSLFVFTVTCSTIAIYREYTLFKKF
jgi:uncharacterized membrane protein